MVGIDRSSRGLEDLDSGRAVGWAAVALGDYHWRWRNFPVPEAHVVLIAGATVLHQLFPMPMRVGRVAKLLGWTATIAGLGLAVEATRLAGDITLERPERLVTSGVYARSRHPMYVGWTLIYGGINLITGNGWLAILSPALAGLVHLETGSEEQTLRSMFGAEYDDYRARVRRYL